MPSGPQSETSRYISFLCQFCGFWFDGQVGGAAVYCAQCGKPRQGEVESAPTPTDDTAAGRGMRVLIAEDSKLLRKAIVKMLTTLGCDVRECEDGQQAIDALDWEPHMLVTDVDMPGANGIELVRAVRAHPKLASIPVVVLTGHADAQTVSEALTLDVMAYLLKERVGSRELRGKLQQCLVAAELLKRRTATRRVVVAEDSDTYRKALVQQLQEMSCEVIEAADGRQALAAIEAQLPDLVISDLEMPHLTGLELLARVRNLPKGERLPFIMLTGKGQGEQMAEAMNQGVTAYILKDQVDARSLRKQIETCLTTASALA